MSFKSQRRAAVSSTWKWSTLVPALFLFQIPAEGSRLFDVLADSRCMVVLDVSNPSGGQPSLRRSRKK